MEGDAVPARGKGGAANAHKKQPYFLPPLSHLRGSIQDMTGARKRNCHASADFCAVGQLAPMRTPGVAPGIDGLFRRLAPGGSPRAGRERGNPVPLLLITTLVL